MSARVFQLSLESLSWKDWVSAWTNPWWISWATTSDVIDLALSCSKSHEWSDRGISVPAIESHHPYKKYKVRQESNMSFVLRFFASQFFGGFGAKQAEKRIVRLFKSLQLLHPTSQHWDLVDWDSSWDEADWADWADWVEPNCPAMLRDLVARPVWRSMESSASVAECFGQFNWRHESITLLDGLGKSYISPGCNLKTWYCVIPSFLGQENGLWNHQPVPSNRRAYVLGWVPGPSIARPAEALGGRLRAKQAKLLRHGHFLEAEKGFL